MQQNRVPPSKDQPPPPYSQFSNIAEPVVRAYPPGTILQIPSRWNIKQNWMWGDMTIKDEWGNDVFQANSKLFTIGRELHFFDMRTGAEIGYIKQQIRLGMQKYSIYLGGTLFAEMTRKFKLSLSPEFIIESVNRRPISVSGDWFAHSYIFTSGNETIATVSKSFPTLRDNYSVLIRPGEDVIFILACCIIIDKCMTKT